jgi:signal transduction histidine kinase
MSSVLARSAGALPSPAPHFVQFYEQDGFLVEEVAGYIGAGLRAGATGIVIARRELLDALLPRLQPAHARLVGAHQGELIALDAQQTLDTFMVDGWPDENLFRQSVGAVVERAAHGGRPVRAFGEMVALLCQQDLFQAAVRLEELWNDLGGMHSFSLFCAYPLRLFSGLDEGQARAFQHICAAHGHVAPTENAPAPRDAQDSLAIARLQQQAAALERAMAEREQMVAQLSAANRAKDEFLAMLGHELRNPLSPIVTALELMKLRGDTATAREQALIRRQVDHLLRLVDDLLDVSRITRGQIELRKEQVLLSEVLAKAIEMAAPLVEQRQHRLEVDQPPPALRIEADPVRLAQVVSNLLTNAARYTDPGGEIRLAATQDQGQLEISVTDNGTGIPQDMLGPIFTMFRQGPRSADRRQGGLGIGLALVKSLVELHGGTVAAHSDGPGRGSCFTLRLPLSESGMSASGGTSRDDSADARIPAGATRGRVLVVDDNAEAADYLGELLRAWGHTTRVAYDPAQALNALDDFSPDVAILDIGLPVMDGYELASRIRDLMGDRPCRLIALSGYGQQADLARSAACGFERHLVKPVDAAGIAAAIRAA